MKAKTVVGVLGLFMFEAAVASANDPVIAHAPPDCAMRSSGKVVRICAFVHDDGKVQETRVYYRVKGESLFRSTEMLFDGLQFCTALPISPTPNESFEYYIGATDEDSRVTRTPMYEIAECGGPGTETRSTQPSASEDASVAHYVKWATEQLRAGMYDAAMAGYIKALEVDPDNTTAVLGVSLARSLKNTCCGPMPCRSIEQTETRLVPAHAAKDDSGFTDRGDFALRRAAGRSSLPAAIVVELNPQTARPGQPYELSVLLINTGQRSLVVRSLEIVSRLGQSPPIGRGQKLVPYVGLVHPGSQALLHKVLGRWTDAQNAGNVEVTLTLLGDDKLVKSVSWR